MPDQMELEKRVMEKKILNLRNIEIVFPIKKLNPELIRIIVENSKKGFAN